MRILGVDPGTRHAGWGVIDCSGNRMQHVAHGVISPPLSGSLAERLLGIDEVLREVIDQYAPDASAVESLFFHKDPQAAAKLGHARGVVLLCLARAKVEAFEYAPARVKLTVAGTGRAGKQQVAMMVKTLFALDRAPKSDAADALALAVTHARRAPIDRALAERAAKNPQLARLLNPSGRPRGRRRASK